MADDRGKRLEGDRYSIRFGYEAITGIQAADRTYLFGRKEDKRKRLTVFEEVGDENTAWLFEFMADPHTITDVELGEYQDRLAASQRNLVVTRNDPRQKMLLAFFDKYLA